MRDKEIVQYGLSSMIKAGADKAECLLTKTEKNELNVEAGEFSLMRTTYNSQMSFKVIKDKRKGSSSSNKTDKESIDESAANAVKFAEASQPDSAYDIAEKQESKIFTSGRAEPDLNNMFARLKNFIEEAGLRYPKTTLGNAILDFSFRQSFFVNSNGADFTTLKGVYNFSAMFSSKEGKKTSSINYSGVATRELDKELLEYGSVNTLMKQSAEQLELKSVSDKFTGDIIITPDCLDEFIHFYTNIFLSDFSLISGTSILKDKLNKQVADPKLTLHSMPVSKEIADNYFVTHDGFKARNSTIVDKGTLKTFLLSLYGSKKTGKERAVNNGGAYVVEPGDQILQEMIKSVKKGLLLCRFSGGYPTDSGDFSGVAKNSYYIEEGEIRYPINETMISGNLAEMFKNIKAISKERIDFGSAIFPWLMVTGITISGK